MGLLQGSKAQLEGVWEQTDHMDREDFDPKTFFKLHGNVHNHGSCLKLEKRI
jgi:hypothetical protein